MSLILLSGPRLTHAVNRADDALRNGERMTKKLVDSLSLLKTRRDELQTKLVEARAAENPELEGFDFDAIFG
ncbi:MAG TPA: hypothetical protein VFC29_09200 [Candidatus Limnocylindrales bacterium]|nr:hypothetical protein [Candidatus Limnocylindrales bacterium]